LTPGETLAAKETPPLDIEDERCRGTPLTLGDGWTVSETTRKALLLLLLLLLLLWQC
jgi:hypothetical protein